MELFTGGAYLCIDIANQFGLDKQQFADRIEWVNDHEHELEALKEDASDEFRYMAAVMAYRNAQDGVPTGHLVGLDACASGLQVMAAVTGCKTTAKNTGLIGDTREDIYTTTTSIMEDLLGGKMSLDPKDVKKSVMTHFYGSKLKPKQTFGDDTPELQAFYEALQIVAPGACQLMEWLLLSWQPYALNHRWTLPDGFDANVPVIQHIDKKIEVDELGHASFMHRFSENIGSEKGLSIAANVVHSIDGFVVRELCRRCNYDKVQLIFAGQCIARHLRRHPMKPFEEHTIPPIEQMYHKTKFLSLVGIENMDDGSVTRFSHTYLEALLELIQDTLDNKSFEVITIHDEFKCHANNVNRMRIVYAELFAELAESTIMDSILSEIRGNPVTITKRSHDLGDDIRQGEYQLC